MKTKERINERILELIEERGEFGREIDHIKKKLSINPHDQARLDHCRNAWNHISAIMLALEWVVDDVRYPV